MTFSKQLKWDALRFCRSIGWLFIITVALYLFTTLALYPFAKMVPGEAIFTLNGAEPIIKPLDITFYRPQQDLSVFQKAAVFIEAHIYSITRIAQILFVLSVPFIMISRSSSLERTVPIAPWKRLASIWLVVLLGVILFTSFRDIFISLRGWAISPMSSTASIHFPNLGVVETKTYYSYYFHRNFERNPDTLWYVFWYISTWFSVPLYTVTAGFSYILAGSFGRRRWLRPAIAAIVFYIIHLASRPLYAFLNPYLTYYQTFPANIGTPSPWYWPLLFLAIQIIFTSLIVFMSDRLLRKKYDTI